MNILLDPMPDFLQVGGEQIPIDSGFRTWIKFDKALFWSKEPVEKRIYAALKICFGDRLPMDIHSAALAAMAFYAGAVLKDTEQSAAKTEGVGSARNSRAYSFTHDASLICAAYRAQYSIDLTKDELHWWLFKALFEGLNEDCKICKIIEIRALDLSQIKDKTQKAHYRRLKRLYKLPDPRTEEEQEADMISAMESIF